MKFDISRLRRAHQVIAGGAIGLFVFMFFFKWLGASYSSSLGGVNVGSSLNGWHSFTDSRWIWLLTIIVALGAVVLVATQRRLELPIEPGVIVAALGALSTLLILYRILHHPSGGASTTVGAVHLSYSFGIKIGIWLGLIAAAAITYGGYLVMREEGTSISEVREQAGGAFKGFASSPGGGPAGSGAPSGETPAAPSAPAPPASPPPAPAAAPPPASSPPAPPLPPPAAAPGEAPPPAQEL
jgi:hypothetical protein